MQIMQCFWYVVVEEWTQRCDLLSFYVMSGTVVVESRGTLDVKRYLKCIDTPKYKNSNLRVVCLRIDHRSSSCVHSRTYICLLRCLRAIRACYPQGQCSHSLIDSHSIAISRCVHSHSQLYLQTQVTLKFLL